MFDLDKFSRINRERCESADGFGHKLDSWSPSDWMVAVCGEVGEAANLVKKLNRCRDGIVGNTIPREEIEHNLLRELSDAMIYIDLMIQSLGGKTSGMLTVVFNRKSDQIGSSIRV